MATRLGIIGGGVMGEALLSRLIAQGIYGADAIWVGEPTAARCDLLRQTYGVTAIADNQAVLDASDVVLLAVKPQIFPAVAAALSPQNPQQLVMSIMAGVPLQTLEAHFDGQPMIRAMPNTPATVGAGMTAIAPGAHAMAEHLDVAQQLFAAVGDVVQVPESMMDAVTGVSGSGPAFVALVVEALADGGVAAGLPRAIAQRLAVQTVRGTAELIQATDLHPAVLKDRVTSPGGTTIAGVAALEKAGLRHALIEAVKAAYRRSQELGKVKD
ncbi:MAG: pyrroline-5-carboxylate reductase [Cyanobacteria bacterium J06638_20]